MRRARVVALMLNGTKHQATGAWMPLADKVAFERQFGISILESVRLTAAAIDDAGLVRPEADASKLREEQPAFFSWRLLHRAGCSVGSFDEFLDGVEEIKIEYLDGRVDPTDPAPPTGT